MRAGILGIENEAYFSSYSDSPRKGTDVVMPQFRGVSVKTRQPAETYGYQVPRYHAHMSHILRPISI